MDRQLTYDGQVPQTTDLLNTNKNVLLGLGYFMQDMLGVSTLVAALPCTPTAPASLNVNVGPGRIYALETVDSVAYSDLGTDTVDSVIKQGINLNTTELSCPAPSTPGTSIIYLIEGTYSENDIDSAVLPYYNATTPASPLSGPGGLGASQPTRRAGSVGLLSKAGIPAATGTEVAPATDSGYVPLYWVTVAYGQTTITGANIQVAPGAPFISGTLLTEAVADGRYLKLAGGVLTGALTGTSAIFQAATVNGINVQNAALFTSGMLAPAQIAAGAPSVNTFARGDSTWSTVSFANLTGQIASGQIPIGAVTQYQSAFSIAWSQITGTKNADQLQGRVLAPGGISYSGFGIANYDGNGDLGAAYFNQGSPNNENPAVSQVIVTTGGDNFFRKAGIAYLLEQMMLSGAVQIQADPGGTPANGTPGTIVFYY
jgi:hypothetical protein